MCPCRAASGSAWTSGRSASGWRGATALVAEHEAVEIVVGLPRSLSGREGPAAETARRYAAILAKRVEPVPVRFADERLTTVSAIRTLSGQGVRGRRQRAVVDQAAAVLILQSWLDSRRSGTVRDHDE
jgi:putative Holliday junction resolvase